MKKKTYNDEHKINEFQVKQCINGSMLYIDNNFINAQYYKLESIERNLAVLTVKLIVKVKGETVYDE